MAVAMCPLSCSAEGARARQTNEVAEGIALDLKVEEGACERRHCLPLTLTFDDNNISNSFIPYVI